MAESARKTTKAGRMDKTQHTPMIRSMLCWAIKSQSNECVGSSQFTYMIWNCKTVELIHEDIEGVTQLDG